MYLESNLFHYTKSNHKRSTENIIDFEQELAKTGNENEDFDDNLADSNFKIDKPFKVESKKHITSSELFEDQQFLIQQNTLMDQYKNLNLDFMDEEVHQINAQ